MGPSLREKLLATLAEMREETPSGDVGALYWTTAIDEIEQFIKEN
jgi:hypothetical protein